MKIIKELVKKELSHLEDDIARANMQLDRTPMDTDLINWRNKKQVRANQIKQEWNELIGTINK